jgi:menaquinone reductase, multiheme cytochrome c subunit
LPDAQSNAVASAGFSGIIEWARKWRFAFIIGTPAYVISLVLYSHAAEGGTEGYYQPVQPIPHSHALHVGELGLDCRYCHTTVETENRPRASEAKCLNCHKSPADDIAEFAPVRVAANGGPGVKWAKVHEVPEWITFNHSHHVKRGVSCEACHGRVDQMEATYQAASLSMGWCIECHRDPTPHLRRADEVTLMGFKPKGGARAHGQKVKNEQGIDPDNGCVFCHRPNKKAKTLDEILR